MARYGSGNGFCSELVGDKPLPELMSVNWRMHHHVHRVKSQYVSHFRKIKIKKLCV